MPPQGAGGLVRLTSPDSASLPHRGAAQEGPHPPPPPRHLSWALPWGAPTPIPASLPGAESHRPGRPRLVPRDPAAPPRALHTPPPGRCAHSAAPPRLPRGRTRRPEAQTIASSGRPLRGTKAGPPGKAGAPPSAARPPGRCPHAWDQVPSNLSEFGRHRAGLGRGGRGPVRTAATSAAAAAKPGSAPAPPPLGLGLGGLAPRGGGSGGGHGEQPMELGRAQVGRGGGRWGGARSRPPTRTERSSAARVGPGSLLTPGSLPGLFVPPLPLRG